MRRNVDVLAVHDLQHVIFRNGRNAFFINQLGTHSLYRSLGGNGID